VKFIPASGVNSSLRISSRVESGRALSACHPTFAEARTEPVDSLAAFIGADDDIGDLGNRLCFEGLRAPPLVFGRTDPGDSRFTEGLVCRHHRGSEAAGIVAAAISYLQRCEPLRTTTGGSADPGRWTSASALGGTTRSRLKMDPSSSDQEHRAVP
jgi:hypothetical protein